jgi:hypothetical protein
MFLTTQELKNHFEPLGFTLEITGQFLAFHKDGVYVTLMPNELIGTVETIQQEVEFRIQAGKNYSANQV